MSELSVTIMYGISVLFVFVLLVLWGIVSYRHQKEEYVPANVKDLNYDEETQTLTFKGARTGNECTAIGKGTVWRAVSGERFGTTMEGKLADIYMYWKRQNNKK